MKGTGWGYLYWPVSFGNWKDCWFAYLFSKKCDKRKAEFNNCPTRCDLFSLLYFQSFQALQSESSLRYIHLQILLIQIRQVVDLLRRHITTASPLYGICHWCGTDNHGQVSHARWITEIHDACVQVTCQAKHLFCWNFLSEPSNNSFY